MGQMNLFEDPGQETRAHPTPEQRIEAIDLAKDVEGISLAELVPDSAVLELNKHYEMRASIISRILGLLAAAESRGESRTWRDVSSGLSIPWAAVKGTFNVMRKMCLVDKKVRLTALGETIVQQTPFLDDIGTLWLLHYLLASNAQLVLWAGLFNSLLHGREVVTVDELSSAFGVFRGRWSDYTLEQKVPTELKAILRTYSEELFAPLGLIGGDAAGPFEVFSNTAAVSPHVLLSILLIYRDRYYPGAATLEVPLITRGNYSPGRIIRLRENHLRTALEDLHNQDLLTIEARADLDQIRFKKGVSWLEHLVSHLKTEGAR